MAQSWRWRSSLNPPPNRAIAKTGVDQRQRLVPLEQQPTGGKRWSTATAGRRFSQRGAAGHDLIRFRRRQPPKPPRSALPRLLRVRRTGSLPSAGGRAKTPDLFPPNSASLSQRQFQLKTAADLNGDSPRPAGPSPSLINSHPAEAAAGIDTHFA